MYFPRYGTESALTGTHHGYKIDHAGDTAVIELHCPREYSIIAGMSQPALEFVIYFIPLATEANGMRLDATINHCRLSEAYNVHAAGPTTYTTSGTTQNVLQQLSLQTLPPAVFEYNETIGLKIDYKAASAPAGETNMLLIGARLRWP